MAADCGFKSPKDGGFATWFRKTPGKTVPKFMLKPIRSPQKQEQMGPEPNEVAWPARHRPRTSGCLNERKIRDFRPASKPAQNALTQALKKRGR